MHASIDVSNQMLGDSAFDMEGKIRGEQCGRAGKSLIGEERADDIAGSNVD
jgi:hypothetical protein